MAGGRYVSASLLADNAAFDRAWAQSAVVADDTADQITKSAAKAGQSAAAMAKAAGASADEQEAAAARAAASYVEAASKITAAQDAAGKAAMKAAELAGAAADEQVAAYQRAVAATGEYEAAQKRAADTSEASSARIKGAITSVANFGKTSLMALAAGAAASVYSAAKLQTQMEQLHTQAGVAQGSIKGLTASVIGMAGSLATDPTQLAQSLYHVESGGIHGAAALNVMATAAKAAKISGADLTDTTTALTATVYSGIKGAQNYTAAMGLLNATVGAGDMTFQKLNEALQGPMLATVKGYGLSLKDVGAALATFGDDNIRGADAATQLRMAVQYMAKPAATATPILEKLGLSTTSFANAMANGGLLPALQLLHDKLVQAQIPAKDYGQVISDIFSKKGASGVTILENSLDKLEQKYKDLATSGGASTFEKDWMAWTGTGQAQADKLKADVEALSDRFGGYLIPKLEDVVGFFEKNKVAADALGIAVAVTLGGAVTVFATKTIVSLVSGIAKAVTAYGEFADVTIPQTIVKLSTLGDSFGAVSSEAAIAGGTLDAEWAAAGARVEATNEAIQASNAETAASFADADAAGGIGAAARFGGLASGAAKALPIFGGGLLAAQLTGLDNITAGTLTGGILKSAASGALAGGTAGAAAGSITGPGAIISGGIGAIAGGIGGIATDLLFGGGGNQAAASDAAIKKLQTDLKGLVSPAQLSTQQLTALYNEAEKILQMPDITAKQQAGLRKLANTLDPSAAGTGIDLTPAYLKKARAAEAQGLDPGTAAFKKATGIGAGPTNIADRVAMVHKQAMEALAKRLAEIHEKAEQQAVNALLSLAQRGAVQAAAANLQAAQVTGQTQIETDAAAAQVTIVKDQQTIASQAMQAAAQHVTDAAAVFSAKMTAAATAITDSSTVASDKSSGIVQAMQDTTQIAADKLGERLLYGYELQAQRDQVQLDVLKAGFDRLIAKQQENLDVAKQHWDGIIAADQIKVATVTEHQDQLVAIAEQRANRVQLHEDTLLGDATNRSDTVQLEAGIKVALAQNAVSLARTPTQKLAAQNQLTLAESQSTLSTGSAAQMLANVTGQVNKAETNAAGMYQHAQDVASMRIAQATSKLTRDQAESTRAEARLSAALQRLTNEATKQEQKWTDLITLTQAGGGRRIKSDATGGLSYVGGGGGGLAVGSETPYRSGKSSGGVNIENVNVNSAPQMNTGELVHEMYLELRSLSTAPPL